MPYGSASGGPQGEACPSMRPACAQHAPSMRPACPTMPPAWSQHVPAWPQHAPARPQHAPSMPQRCPVGSMKKRPVPPFGAVPSSQLPRGAPRRDDARAATSPAARLSRGHMARASNPRGRSTLRGRRTSRAQRQRRAFGRTGRREGRNANPLIHPHAWLGLCHRTIRCPPAFPPGRGTSS